MKKNKKVPLYYLKSLKSINSLQETHSPTQVYAHSSVPTLSQKICQQFTIISSVHRLKTHSGLTIQHPLW